MCLIIHKPADVVFTRDELLDFYARNRDGAGIMWHDGQAVVVKKVTAPTAAEWLNFYEAHATGRECMIHLRWRTHGTITEDNTHPYPVAAGMWLMHNGVLASGNAKDPKKSDTWHFINDTLRDAVKRRGGRIDTEFKIRLGRIIGSSNKFVMIDSQGGYHIVNKRCGVTYKGAWLSNTYAWSAPATRRVHPNMPLALASEVTEAEAADAFAEEFIYKAKSPSKKKAKAKAKKPDPKKPGPVKIWTLAEWNAAHPKTYMQ